MGLESRPTTQSTTAASVVHRGGGKNKTKRLSATTAVETLTIPPRVNGIMLKHKSGSSVQITMDSVMGQSWVIDAGDAPIQFPVADSVEFKYRVVGAGSGELYCIFY